MNRAISLIIPLLLGTCLLAQSGNSQFIDSPSWILAGESSLDGIPSATVIPVTSQAQSKTSKKSQDTPSRSSRDEGFLHTPTIMLDMRLFNRFYVGVGVDYNTWGGKISLINGVQDLKRSFSFSYVEIPVRVKIQTRNFADSRASIFLSAGANLGFGVDFSYKDKYKDLGITAPISSTGDFVSNSIKIKDNRKLANLSVVGQVGVNYQLSRRLNLLVGIEYHYGCIRPLKSGENSPGPDFNNQQIGLVLGIMF